MTQYLTVTLLTIGVNSLYLDDAARQTHNTSSQRHGAPLQAPGALPNVPEDRSRTSEVTEPPPAYDEVMKSEEKSSRGPSNTTEQNGNVYFELQV